MQDLEVNILDISIYQKNLTSLLSIQGTSVKVNHPSHPVTFYDLNLNEDPILKVTVTDEIQEIGYVNINIKAEFPPYTDTFVGMFVLSPCSGTPYFPHSMPSIHVKLRLFNKEPVQVVYSENRHKEPLQAKNDIYNMYYSMMHEYENRYEQQEKYIENLVSSISETRDNSLKLEKEIYDLREENNRLNASVLTLKTSLQGANALLNMQKENNDELNLNVRKSESELQDLHYKYVNELEKVKHELGQKCNELEHELNRKMEELFMLRKENQDLRENLSNTEKNMDFQIKTASKRLDSLEFISKEQMEENYRLKSVINKMKLIYTPDPNDPIDIAVAEYVNTYKLRIRVYRVDSGLYMLGDKKVVIKEEHGHPLVRIGGGFVTMADFFKLNSTNFRQYSANTKYKKTGTLKRRSESNKHLSTDFIKTHIQA